MKAQYVRLIAAVVVAVGKIRFALLVAGKCVSAGGRPGSVRRTAPNVASLIDKGVLCAHLQTSRDAM